jgi:hypothetical protein
MNGDEFSPNRVTKIREDREILKNARFTEEKIGDVLRVAIFRCNVKV